MVRSNDHAFPAGHNTEILRWVCPVLDCAQHNKRNDDLSRHFKKVHPEYRWAPKVAIPALTADLDANPQLAASLSSPLPFANSKDGANASTASIFNTMSSMDLSSGRGQREKKPTEKVKETTVKKEEPVISQLVPPKYKLPEPDPKWLEEPKEIPKTFDHTKINKVTGERFDFYKLGPQ
jgi:hypothetical protein